MLFLIHQCRVVVINHRNFQHIVRVFAAIDGIKFMQRAQALGE